MHAIRSYLRRRRSYGESIEAAQILQRKHRRLSGNVEQDSQMAVLAAIFRKQDPKAKKEDAKEESAKEKIEKPIYNEKKPIQFDKK